jgi:hypothetical protein
MRNISYISVRLGGFQRQLIDSWRMFAVQQDMLASTKTVPDSGVHDGSLEVNDNSPCFCLLKVLIK